ncbi:MAG TPA: hypothetical protein VK163_05550 [Opitutaceae bacterium]|nr:hypothetical protein [Opitutaceae bacterium]
MTWYEEMLAVFARDFGEKKLDDITRPKLLAWIKGRSAGSQPHYFRVVRALFRWAAAQETRLVGLDPTANVEIEEVRKDKTIRFLTVAEAETVLRKDVRHRAAHALSLFAGVRPEEIAGKGKTWLPWSAVNEEERILRIPAECSKTRRARIIEGLPEALWLWLATIPREERGESVGVAAAQQVARAARSALGLKKWPQDVMRHTFATYAVALTGDPAKVSLWLGHEGRPTLLHTTYRGLATKAQAEAFFGLRP